MEAHAGALRKGHAACQQLAEVFTARVVGEDDRLKVAMSLSSRPLVKRF